MLDLHDQLSSLATRWESDSPPITLDEAMAGARGVVVQDEGAVDESFVTISPLESAMRRRWRPLIMAAAAAMLVIVGLVALTRGDRSDQQPFRPGDESIAPQPTLVDSAPASTAGATTVAVTVATTTPATQASTSSIGGGPTNLSTVQGSAAAGLATFNAFRATATMHFASSPNPGDSLVDSPVTVNDVVMAADGSMWSKGTPVTWSSYDATTGIARTHTVIDGGSEINTQYNAWSSVPFEVILGLDPTPDLSALGTDPEIDDAVQDGRPVWQISSQHDTTGPGGSPSRIEETLAIDKATGLMIGYAKTTSAAAGVTSTLTATLTNLEIGVEVPPPDFDNSFAPGANVDSSGDPASFHLLTVEEAATRFGSGFVAPDALPTTARILFEGGLSVVTVGENPGVVTAARRNKVTMEFPDGFAPRSMTVSKDLGNGDGSAGDGAAVCRTVDGKTCLGSSGASVITAGPLQGVPSELHLGVLTIHDGLVTIVVRAPTDAQALELANKLHRIG
jgi:hypothetical protein